VALGRKPQIATVFEALDAVAREKLLRRLTGLFLLLSLIMGAVGASLVTDAAPLGIVTLEFAGTSAVARRVLASWPEALQRTALLGLVLDSLYLLVYPVLLSLACLRTAERFEQAHVSEQKSPAAKIGRCLAIVVLAAAPFDGVENFALVRALIDGPSDAWAGIAWWCAVTKFGLIIAAVLYVTSPVAGYWREIWEEGAETE